MPILFPGEKENHEAFVKHLDGELTEYGNVTILNLVDQTGKEKIIQDTFLDHVVKYNNSKLTFVAFDFHEYWYVLMTGTASKGQVKDKRFRKNRKK